MGNTASKKKSERAQQKELKRVNAVTQKLMKAEGRLLHKDKLVKICSFTDQLGHKAVLMASLDASRGVYLVRDKPAVCQCLRVGQYSSRNLRALTFFQGRDHLIPLVDLDKIGDYNHHPRVNATDIRLPLGDQFLAFVRSQQEGAQPDELVPCSKNENDDDDVGCSETYDPTHTTLNGEDDGNAHNASYAESETTSNVGNFENFDLETQYEEEEQALDEPHDD